MHILRAGELPASDQPQVKQDDVGLEQPWQDLCDPAGRDTTFSAFFSPHIGHSISLS